MCLRVLGVNVCIRAYERVCVRECIFAFVSVCVCVDVCGCEYACMCVCARVCG